MIHVLAIITTNPGHRARVLEAFNANRTAVLAEDGCIEYGAATDVEGTEPAFGPDAFVVIEKWASMEQLKAHAASRHMASYREQTAALVAGRAVHILAPV
jgi:quinol monooxygenase YgiN